MFNTPEEFAQYIQQQIIDRHPKDLSIVLRAYEVFEEPTPLVLLLMYQRFGDEFLQDLAAVLPEDRADGFLGTLQDIFKAGKEVVTTVKDATSSGESTPAPTDTKPKPKKWTTKKIVLIGVGVIVLLSVIIYFVRKK